MVLKELRHGEVGRKLLELRGERENVEVTSEGAKDSDSEENAPKMMMMVLESSALFKEIWASMARGVGESRAELE